MKKTLLAVLVLVVLLLAASANSQSPVTYERLLGADREAQLLAGGQCESGQYERVGGRIGIRNIFRQRRA